MARVNNLNDFLTDVAGAIKTKKGSETAIPAANFDTEILALPSQGTYEQKTLRVSTNGTQTVVPSSGFDAIDELDLTVAVPEKQLQTKSYSFTQNTAVTLEPDTGYDGFNTVTLDINVPGSQINNQDKTITQNGSYTADQGYTGLGTVTVNVPSGGGEIDITTTSGLPSPIRNMKSYRDNSGDLHLTWKNPTQNFSGNVALVRKENAIPTLPIGNQTYQLLEDNTESIVFDKQTIAPNTKYGFLALPLNDDGYIQTEYSATAKILDSTINIQNDYAEINLPEDLQSLTALNSYIDKSGNVFLSTQSSSVTGIWVLDKSQNALVKLYENGYYWTNFFEDKDGNVFIASTITSGIVRYDSEQKTISQVYSAGTNWGVFFQTSEGDILASYSSSTYDGILKYNTTTGLFDQIYYSGYNHKYFYEDTEGNTFIAPSITSDNNQILLYSNGSIASISNFTNYPSYSIDTIYEDSYGNVFFLYCDRSAASNGITIYIYDEDTGKVKNMGMEKTPYRIYEDKSGNLFLVKRLFDSNTALGSDCVFKLNRETNQFYAINVTTKSSTSSGEWDTVFHVSGNNEVFLLSNAYDTTGLTSGLYKYNNANDTFEIVPTDLSSFAFVLSERTNSWSMFYFYEDSYNNVFITCENYGVNSSAGTNTTNTFMYDRTNNGILDVSATVAQSAIAKGFFSNMIEVSPGELYLSNSNYTFTDNKGLFKFDYTNKVFNRVADNGLLYTLLKDDENETLFGTNIYAENSTNNYFVKYNKNNDTYTEENNRKYGIKLGQYLFINSYRVYNADTDVVDTVNGNYETAVNISDTNTFNYALSLATSTKYLIYSK